MSLPSKNLFQDINAVFSTKEAEEYFNETRPSMIDKNQTDIL